MPSLPPAVERLLAAPGGAGGDEAWQAFLEEHSPLLLSVAHAAASEHDEALDHYAFMLERLQEHEFRRLRAYTANGAAEFTTWLTVVAKRLCVDSHRRRVGRPQADGERSPRAEAEWQARRNLADLVAADVDLDRLRDDSSPDPEQSAVDAERRSALADAIGDLDRQDQLLLVLRFEDGLGPSQIAAVFDLPTRFHVHRRLKRVLEHLRHSLAERGIDDH